MNRSESATSAADRAPSCLRALLVELKARYELALGEWPLGVIAVGLHLHAGPRFAQLAVVEHGIAAYACRLVVVLPNVTGHDVWIAPPNLAPTGFDPQILGSLWPNPSSGWATLCTCGGAYLESLSRSWAHQKSGRRFAVWLLSYPGCAPLGRRHTSPAGHPRSTCTRLARAGRSTGRPRPAQRARGRRSLRRGLQCQASSSRRRSHLSWATGSRGARHEDAV